jgi:hypothetical protein
MTPHSLRRDVSWIQAAALLAVTATPAAAHHEAIFGTQSALVLTSSRYLTAQVFTRQTGDDAERVQETTTVLSAGYSPAARPLSLSVVVPFSFLSESGPGRTRVGWENALVGARYRFDLFDVAGALSVDESYVITAGGLELPTGTLDHPFGDGAMAVIAAGLMGIEKGRFSASGYAFFRRPGEHDEIREGSNRFLGGGAGWTVHEDAATSRLVILNLGLSYETMFADTVHDAADPGSGGSGFFLHPTALIGVSPRLMLFGQASIGVRQDWKDPADRERFRVGAGAILALGY